jgi:hypothetical protein
MPRRIGRVRPRPADTSDYAHFMTIESANIQRIFGVWETEITGFAPTRVSQPRLFTHPTYI